MNFIKRGWLSLTRRKGKALILFAVIFILGNVMAGAVSIRQASGNVEKVIKQQLGSTSTIDIDFKAMEKAYQEEGKFDLEPLDPELLNQIGASLYVKHYDYSLSTIMDSAEVKPFKAEKSDEGGMMMAMNLSGGEFTLNGVQYPDILDFEEGKGKLLEGRTFTPEEIEKGERVTLISKKVADENNLKVGDQLVMKKDIIDYSQGFSADNEPVATRDLPLTIIGIFEPVIVEPEEGEKDEMGQSQMDFANTTYQNTLYTPNKVAQGENQFEQEELAKVIPEGDRPPSGDQYFPTYVLKNPDMVEAFKAEVEPLIPKQYVLNSSTDEYDRIAGPIKSMEKLSTYVLLAAVGASLLIVSLVVLLFLRDRKHEFGVYLSLGEKRQRVVGQIVFEMLVIGCLALGLSVFSGNLLASGLSSSMIQNQIEAQAAQEHNGGTSSVTMIGGPMNQSNVSEEDVSEAYQVNLSVSYLLSFFTVSLGTILCATIIPMIYLIRLNPKKIML